MCTYDEGHGKPKVLVLTGATAVGKTATSIKLAKLLQGEIVSADSVQVYKGLDVGSDKVCICPAYIDGYILINHINISESLCRDIYDNYVLIHGVDYKKGDGWSSTPFD